MSARAVLPWLGFALLTVFGCIEDKASHIARVDSESHWLTPCAVPDDCGDTLECRCGVCSRACADAMDCGGEAVCVEPGGVCGGALCTTPCGGGCPDGLRCADDACVPVFAPVEVCDLAADEEGDGATDCADPDCLADPTCANAAAAFAPDDALQRCAAGEVELRFATPEEALAGTVQADAQAVDDLTALRDRFSLIAAMSPGPGIGDAAADLRARFDAVLPVLQPPPVDFCVEPECAPDAMLAAELRLIADIADAIERLDPTDAVRLPYVDCLLASTRLRLARQTFRWQQQCPDQPGQPERAALLNAWPQWTHSRSLRLQVQCAFTAAYNACVPAAQGAAALAAPPECPADGAIIPDCLACEDCRCLSGPRQPAGQCGPPAPAEAICDCDAACGG
ncbi:MAG: hypothetical protein KC620_01855 [Myxococcales bacterium]|nr:hypothetical protein [Myxococcales bacterium]